MRRAAWRYTDGVRVIAEYWPTAAAVTVVSQLLEPHSLDSLMELELEWGDVFDIDIRRPLSRPMTGLRIGAGGLRPAGADAAAFRGSGPGRHTGSTRQTVDPRSRGSTRHWTGSPPWPARASVLAGRARRSSQLDLLVGGGRDR